MQIMYYFYMRIENKSELSVFEGCIINKLINNVEKRKERKKMKYEWKQYRHRFVEWVVV